MEMMLFEGAEQGEFTAAETLEKRREAIMRQGRRVPGVGRFVPHLLRFSSQYVYVYVYVCCSIGFRVFVIVVSRHEEGRWGFFLFVLAPIR